MSEFRIVVLASGSGTNLQAILDSLHGREGIAVVGVGSDKPGARALERAVAVGVETAVFPIDAYADRLGRDGAMADWADSHRPDLLLPQPLGPMIAVTLPGMKRQRRSSSATVGAPDCAA